MNMTRIATAAALACALSLPTPALARDHDDVNIAVASVQMATSYAHTGAAITPRPVVYLSLDQALPLADDDYDRGDYQYKGRYFDQDDLMVDPSNPSQRVYVLEEGDDYVLSYRNNVETGTATVVIRGIDDLYGTLEKTFAIAGESTGGTGGSALDPSSPLPVRRLWGATRYDTMSAIVEEAFDERETTAIVASGKNYPDALAASALAGAYDAPVILTDPQALSKQASSQLKRLGVSRVLLMGGSVSVSNAVQSAIEGMNVQVTRVAGTDRIGTSLAAMDKTFAADDDSHTVIVANGYQFADALSIGPWAYDSESPIVLTRRDGTLTDEAASAIRKVVRVRRIILVGGTSAVSDAVRTQLGEGYQYERLGGATRSETSVAVARWSAQHGLDWTEPCIASGKSFPDALAGAALAGDEDSVLLLVSSPNDAAVAEVAANSRRIKRLYVLGGQSVVPVSLVQAIQDAASPR